MLITPTDKSVTEVRSMLPNASQTAFTCSKSKMETPEQCLIMFKVDNSVQLFF